MELTFNYHYKTSVRSIFIVLIATFLKFLIILFLIWFPHYLIHFQLQLYHRIPLYIKVVKCSLSIFIFLLIFAFLILIDVFYYLHRFLIFIIILPDLHLYFLILNIMLTIFNIPNSIISTPLYIKPLELNPPNK